jgi:hypothetical protein
VQYLIPSLYEIITIFQKIQALGLGKTLRHTSGKFEAFWNFITRNPEEEYIT